MDMEEEEDMAVTKREDTEVAEDMEGEVATKREDMAEVAVVMAEEDMGVVAEEAHIHMGEASTVLEVAMIDLATTEACMIKK